MRKIGLAVGSVLLFCLTTAVPALAGSEIPDPDGPKVLGHVVRADGTAFTGASIAPWLIALAVLLAVGATLLVLGRRRSAVHS